MCKKRTVSYNIVDFYNRKRKPALLLPKKRKIQEVFLDTADGILYFICQGSKQYAIFGRSFIRDNSPPLIQSSQSLRVFSL
jgi:hypothetical protein